MWRWPSQADGPASSFVGARGAGSLLFRENQFLNPQSLSLYSRNDEEADLEMSRERGDCPGNIVCNDRQQPGDFDRV